MSEGPQRIFYFFYPKPAVEVCKEQLQGQFSDRKTRRKQEKGETDQTYKGAEEHQTPKISFSSFLWRFVFSLCDSSYFLLLLLAFKLFPNSTVRAKCYYFPVCNFEKCEIKGFFFFFPSFSEDVVANGLILCGAGWPPLLLRQRSTQQHPQWTFFFPQKYEKRYSVNPIAIKLKKTGEESKESLVATMIDLL